jgi:diaminohydroxyphosphoribosylaminopyrimidine deaminase/5-amino-6-(5-phosphoribosylamino)uracil reductase
VFTALAAQDRDHVQYVKADFSKNILPFVMENLYERKISSVIIEGGAYLLNSFIASGLWDEARIFTGSKEFGAGLPGPVIQGAESYQMKMGEDSLLVLDNPATGFL